MRILAAVQAIFGVAFILLGLVALFGIGITGLIYLAFGAAFAATASLDERTTRAAVAAALTADAVLAYMSVVKLEALLTSDLVASVGTPGLIDYLVPAAALALVAIAAVAVAHDWRSLRNAPWF